MFPLQMVFVPEESVITISRRRKEPLVLPPSWFQKTVISSTLNGTPVGLLIVMVRFLPEIVSDPCATRLQFEMGVAEGVGVKEGVNV